MTPKLPGSGNHLEDRWEQMDEEENRASCCGGRGCMICRCDDDYYDDMDY